MDAKKMIGRDVVHCLMMTGGDGHYVNNLVNGSRMLDFFGDVATELLVRCDDDLSLFLGYDEEKSPKLSAVAESERVVAV